MKIHTFAIFFAASVSCPASAFEIVDQSKSVEIGAATVVHLDNEIYALVDIPERAPMLEVTDTKPVVAEGTNISPGCPMEKQETIKVLEAWFRKYSFDFASVQLRNLNVSTQKYVVWCDNPLFFVCSNWQIRSGIWVDFEVNGKNQYGGMTGFRHAIKLIRKSPKNSVCAD